MRFSGTVDWKHYSFGLGYEFGFMNAAKSGEYSDFDGEKSIREISLFLWDIISKTT